MRKVWRSGRHSWLGLVGSAGLMAAMLSGCGTSSHAAQSPVRGGTAVVALGPLVTLDWYLPFNPVGYNSLYDHWLSSAMYKSLFHVGPSGKIDYSRSIASAITWNSAGTVFTVRMHRKWRWSDGTPVTASDVLFTWHLIQEASASNAPAPWPYTNAGSGGIPNLISRVQTVNAHEFTVTLNRPVDQLWFLYNGLADFIPLPAQAWNKYPSSPAQELNYLSHAATSVAFFQHTPIDGPFRLSSAVPNQSWTLTRNPAYDGHKASLQKLIFAYETSNVNEVDQLKTGTVQIGYLPFSMAALQKQLPKDKLAVGQSFSVYKTVLNFRNPTVGPLLQQMSVREALQMGIDQQAIIQTLYHGYGVTGTGPVPTHPPTFLAPQLKTAPYPYDPTKGRRLLEAHGWHLVNGVMQNARGQSLRFTMQYRAGSNSETALVQLLKQDWQREGIQVSLQPLPFATIIHNKRVPSKWELQTGLGWDYGGSYPTGGGQFGPHGPFNSAGYQSATASQLIAATHRPHRTAAGAQAALDQYQVYIADHLPVLWMPAPDQLMEVATTMHGVTSSTNNFTGAISPQYWWTGR